MHLLLIEDDIAMRLTLRRAFERWGIKTVVCQDGLQAIDFWRAYMPDVVVLDLCVPGMAGLEILSRARGQGLFTPVLILTARDALCDRIMGLNAGADACLSRPFHLDELEARVRALVRRQPPDVSGISSACTPRHLSQCLRLDPESSAIYLNDEVLRLPPRENALLRALLLTPGTVVSKERLFNLVFPGETPVRNDAIEVVVYRARQKLKGTDARIMTLRGLGYVLHPLSA